MRRPRALLVAAALLGMGAAGLYLRLRHNGYGLPYVYNYDEATHFTNHSVHMLGSDLDPGYYQNPSGFACLGYFALRGVYGLLGAHLHYGTIGRQFKGNDTPVFELTRGLAAVLAMAGAATVFWVGRRVWGTAVGLVAAALLTFAFLPVTYSRIAVTDVGAFLPVALSLYGAVLVYERGRWRDYLLAGAAAGLAVGFKYTAGLVILPALVAGGLRLWGEPGPLVRRPALRRDRRRGLVLLVFPVALYLYMGGQSRYFGRWMLPMYPLLALLAAVAIVWLARRVRVRPLVQVLVGAAALAAVLVQPLAADVRTATVLGRTDTRQLLRDYLAAHYPRGLRVVVEPAVPDNYYDVGYDFNRRKQLISGFVLDIRRQAGADAPEGTNSTYATTLQPALIDHYRQTGFCL